LGTCEYWQQQGTTAAAATAAAAVTVTPVMTLCLQTLHTLQQSAAPLRLFVEALPACRMLTGCWEHGCVHITSHVPPPPLPPPLPSLPSFAAVATRVVVA
jgi:hypothetical protein